MDRRLSVIIAICLIEVGFRLLSACLSIDGLLYTLAARLVEMGFIFIFAFRLCGILAASLKKELVIGLVSAAVFGAVVLAIDLVSRFFMEKGLVGILLTKQHIDQWFVFFITGCLVGPFVEELFFRGMIYTWLRQRLSAALCIILTSLLFASMHGHISMIQLTGGIIFASIYEWRKTIWAPFVVHALANIGILIIPYLHPLI